MSGVNTYKESIPITIKNVKLTEIGNLRVWCITQKPTKQEAYMDERQ